MCSQRVLQLSVNIPSSILISLSLIDRIKSSATLASQMGGCMSYNLDILLCFVILFSTRVTGHSLEFDFIENIITL